MRQSVIKHLKVLDYLKHDCTVVYFNALFGVPKWLGNVDWSAVVLHVTLLRTRWHSLYEMIKKSSLWLAGLECPKVAIPQDEYDHCQLLDEWLECIAATDIFTNFKDHQQRKHLYPKMCDKARFHECLTGYIDEDQAKRIAAKLVPLKQRPVDIVYRATKLPYQFGSGGQLKHEIAKIVEKKAKELNITCDISTCPSKVIKGDAWLKFLAQGKAVIGCESGSSVLDGKGEIRHKINKLLKLEPTAHFVKIANQLGVGWDDNSFFTIGPRHLEAVITKTCQFLVEGHYAGILMPYRHYLPIKRDFSNLEDVLERLKYPEELQEMVDRAYQDIWLNGGLTYRDFADQIRQALHLEKKRIEPSFLGNGWMVIARLYSGMVTAVAVCLFLGSSLLRTLRAGAARLLSDSWSSHI